MESDQFRQHVQVGMAVVVDESSCIVLETCTPGGDVLSRITLSDCDRVTDAMELARVFVAARMDDDDSRRRSWVLANTVPHRLWMSASGRLHIKDRCSGTGGTGKQVQRTSAQLDATWNAAIAAGRDPSAELCRCVWRKVPAAVAAKKGR